MRPKVSDVPLAVASDGTVIVNVTHFFGVKAPAELLALALAEHAAIYIGVTLRPAEVEKLVKNLRPGTVEAAAYLLGGRLRSRREREGE